MGKHNPMKQCPEFDGCSAPICPLDPGMHKRSGPFPGEPVCTLSKAKRLELGQSLPWRGLWPRELAGLKQWENATEVQRTEKGRQLASRREKSPITNGLGG